MDSNGQHRSKHRLRVPVKAKLVSCAKTIDAKHVQAGSTCRMENVSPAHCSVRNVKDLIVVRWLFKGLQWSEGHLINAKRGTARNAIMWIPANSAKKAMRLITISACRVKMPLYYSLKSLKVLNNTLSNMISNIKMHKKAKKEKKYTWQTKKRLKFWEVKG